MYSFFVHFFKLMLYFLYNFWQSNQKTIAFGKNYFRFGGKYMKHIQKKQSFFCDNNFKNIIFDDNCIFFDIETTGFSAKTSTLYLIGCLYKKESDIVMEQFFAESKDDEKEVLLHFIELLSNYKTIFSFNGLGFDLPFIKAKCETYGITHNFDQYQYIDIFKEVTNIKFLLKLPNYKQKTIEDFLGIYRNDKYSGGELISIYEEYVQTKDAHSEELLLLHNYEDVVGMLDLLPILSYRQILKDGYHVKNAETTTYTNYDGECGLEMIITLQNKYSVPQRISHQCNEFYITMNKDLTKIRIPVFEGELKFFYSNYKDYYYLPVEDMAIHKSVASFVDKEYREKAKACNCYTRKTSQFLPQYDSIMNPSFKKEHKDKCTYFELTEDFMTSSEMLQRYVEHIFNIL